MQRPPRVGADGEFAVAQLLATLTEVSRWDRWRGRPQQWWVLHSVPLGDGRGDGQAHTDVDHLLIGPPGVVSINTKHHRTGKLYLDGDQLVLNGRRTDYVPKPAGKPTASPASCRPPSPPTDTPSWPGGCQCGRCWPSSAAGR